jgi:hypothetical protein
MDKDRLRMSMLFPLLAMITVAVYAGGLGVIFMIVNETSLHEWGVIIIGVALVIGVPTAAAIAQKAVEK